MAIEYRLCATNEEYEAVKALEILIWQMQAGEAITTHILHILNHVGGIVMGAYDGDTMIGMAVGTPTKEAGQLWSHMAGVHPDYQGQGIGYEIKQFQREWALKNGYTEMRWTFDPAMRRNAHFNFHLLGAMSNVYHENFYGMMSDGINAGVPSDRFEAIWKLDAERPLYSGMPAQLPFLLEDDNQQPRILGKAREAYHAIICPYDFHTLKAQSLDLAIQWRHAMRDVLQSAFERDYAVVDFVTDRPNRQAYYVLAHRS